MIMEMLSLWEQAHTWAGVPCPKCGQRLSQYGELLKCYYGCGGLWQVWRVHRAYDGVRPPDAPRPWASAYGFEENDKGSNEAR